MRGYVDRDRVAADGVLEIETQLVAKIGAAEDLAAALAAATEDVAENVAEDVAEALGRESAHPARTAGTGTQAVVTEAVVSGAFICVTQDVISLLGLLELGLGSGVVLVAVGVVLHGKTPIGLLDLVG